MDKDELRNQSVQPHNNHNYENRVVAELLKKNTRRGEVKLAVVLTHLRGGESLALQGDGYSIDIREWQMGEGTENELVWKASPRGVRIKEDEIKFLLDAIGEAKKKMKQWKEENDRLNKKTQQESRR